MHFNYICLSRRGIKIVENQKGICNSIGGLIDKAKLML